MKKLAKVAVATILAASTACAFASCDKRIAIGVQSGTTGQYFVDGDADWGFDGLTGYKSKGYTSGGLAVNDLKNGNVKYVIIDQMPAKELDEAIEGIKVIDIPLTEEEYAFGVDKAQPQLLADVNAILESPAFATKYAEILLAYATGVGITPVTSAAEDVSNPDGQLVVATNAEFAPFEYKVGNKFAGIDMEIAAYVASELGMELVIKNMDFEAVVTSVGVNGIDIAMAGLTVDETRKQSVNFTVSYYDAAQVLITLDGDTNFDDCTTAEDVIAKLEALAK